MATFFLGFQQPGVFAADTSEMSEATENSSTSYQFNQRTGVLTLNLVSSGKSETVFVSILNNSGSTSMAGTYMYYDRLTVMGGTGTFTLDVSFLIPGTYTISINGQSINFEDEFIINSILSPKVQRKY